VSYSQVGIELKNAAFSWGFNIKQNAETNAGDLPVVADLNVKLGASDLVIVVGKIGSGKSTLLHSIMDETIKVQGDF
jgi:ABC-type lipoprotein export system ATPase subunit